MSVPAQPPSDADDTDALSELDPEVWLANRLMRHGHDIYAGGPYADYGERLGACIVRNGCQYGIAGRNKQGKPETYVQLYRRIYGKSLPNVSRGTQTHAQHQTQQVTP